MRETAVQQAEEVVMQKESEVVNMMFKELCVKHVEAIEALLGKELDRIAPPIQ